MGETVFVLGAAANKEFDSAYPMPVGSELAQAIQNVLRADLQNLDNPYHGEISGIIMRDGGGFSDKHIAAMKRIEAGIAFKESIDEFIDEWKDLDFLEYVAKTCIAKIILDSERNMCLGRVSTEPLDISYAMSQIRESWLGLLLRLVNPQIRRRDTKSSLDGISFVTFNYDRCLEQAIFFYLHHTQGMSIKEASNRLAEIPIFHVYGSLGKLPIQEKEGIPFGAPQIYAAKAARDIRTFTEEIDSQHALNMQKLVKDAEKIVFLGFGYHERNMEILRTNDCSDQVQIFGTSKGMRAPKMAYVQNQFMPEYAQKVILDSHCNSLIWDMQDALFALRD